MAKTKKQKRPSQAERRTKNAAPARQRQNRREMWAIFCIVLTLFSIICCFNINAVLLKPLITLIAGLFGQPGRYLLPVFLIVTTVILFSSRGKPVRLRIACAFAIVITISAIYHLIQGPELRWQWSMVKTLFQGGQDGTTGGLIAGFFAAALQTCLTTVGAYIVLALLLLVQLITTMNMTVNSLITAIKNRPRVPGTREPEEDEPEQDTAERIVNHMANKHIERVERRRAAEIDIPVDDPPALKETKKRLEKDRPLSPDQ